MMGLSSTNINVQGTKGLGNGDLYKLRSVEEGVRCVALFEGSLEGAIGSPGPFKVWPEFGRMLLGGVSKP